LMESGKGISRACRVLGLSKTCYYYVGIRDDSQVESALRKKAEDVPREGFLESVQEIAPGRPLLEPQARPPGIQAHWTEHQKESKAAIASKGKTAPDQAHVAQ